MTYPKRLHLKFGRFQQTFRFSCIVLRGQKFAYLYHTYNFIVLQTDEIALFHFFYESKPDSLADAVERDLACWYQHDSYRHSRPRYSFFLGVIINFKGCKPESSINRFNKRCAAQRPHTSFMASAISGIPFRMVSTSVLQKETRIKSFLTASGSKVFPVTKTTPFPIDLFKMAVASQPSGNRSQV